MARMQRILLKIRKKAILGIKLVNRNKYFHEFYKILKAGGIKMNGTPYFISDDVWLDDTDWGRITIDDKVTISKGVTILVHDFSVSRPIEMNEPEVKRAYILDDVHLCEGCFIGAGVIILPGTTVGKNTIIGAGSVIKGIIPDNVVVAGNPAKLLKTNEKYYEKICSMKEDMIFRVTEL